MTLTNTIASRFFAYPKTAATLLGTLCALAMAPTFFWPLMIAGFSGLVLLIDRAQTPKQGAWRVFMFSMGYFTIGLYWVSNALLLKVADFWWMVGFAILGLPLLLSICWWIAGYLAVRLAPARSLARGILLVALLAAAEYARAFNLSGFPWNLPAYMWGFSLPMMQTAALGGAYLLAALTIFWAATPALVFLACPRKALQIGLGAVSTASLVACLVSGMMRLDAHPVALRDDFAAVIVQPNIDQAEKWTPGKEMDHFNRHVALTQKGLAAIPPTVKAVAVVWPETALDEKMVLETDDVPRTLVTLLSGHPFDANMVGGLWRTDAPDAGSDTPRYYNSIAAISVADGKLQLDDVYDKHHLVPFGEYIPLEKTLHLTPLVGFAGFESGPGPVTLHPSGTPPATPMICFEAIFPWYAHSAGAQWLVNTSNDGWYGDTPGPYQHLVMSRFRSIEQGLPMARSATTGLSALIDPYGRTVRKLAYETEGVIAMPMPAPADAPTLYSQVGEMPFFMLLIAFAGIFAILRFRKI